MQNDRYLNRGIAVGHCVWCRSEYVVNCSRARAQTLFCSKKCEVEARFWLLDVLKSLDEARRKSDDESAGPPA